MMMKQKMQNLLTLQKVKELKKRSTRRKNLKGIERRRINRKKRVQKFTSAKKVKPCNIKLNLKMENKLLKTKLSLMRIRVPIHTTMRKKKE